MKGDPYYIIHSQPSSLNWPGRSEDHPHDLWTAFR